MNNSITASTNAALEIEALESRFKSAWQFLKQTRTTADSDGKSKPLVKLPWYLLIGASHAGKTQLIKHANIKLVSAPYFATDPTDEISVNKHCNFWFSENATILDTPSSFFDATSDATGSSKNLDFLNALKKYTARKPLSGILVAIDIANWILATKADQQKFVSNLKLNLLTIAKKLGAACPIYLIFTHVDRINGFSEFFAELGQEERKQPWGISFNSHTTITDFKINYERLLKRLHERVIWRLQQERSLEKRVKIQEFPLQMETLKEGLANCVYQLTDIIKPHGLLSLNGIYFVSNLQDGNSVDGLYKLPVTTMSTANSPRNTSVASHKLPTSAYFSEQLFSKIILSPAAKTQNNNQIDRKIYLAAISFTLFFVAILIYGYFTKATAVANAQVALAEYREATQNIPIQERDLNRNLLPLKHLQAAVDALHSAALPRLIAQGFSTPSAQTLIDDTYQAELNIRFLPSLGKALEQALVTEQDPTTLYGLLKIYLMLGTPEYFDSKFIQSWLNNYWKNSIQDNNQSKKQLASHLNALFAKPIVPLALTSTIVTQARHKLNSFNSAQLAFAILQNHRNTAFFNPLQIKPDNKNSLKKIFPILENFTGISNIYTANQFQNVYFQQINQACQTAIIGDWIIGKRREEHINEQELINNVRILYLKNYTLQWQGLLNSLQVAPPQNGEQLLRILNMLLGSQAPLTKILQVVKANTALPNIILAKEKMTATDLANIQNYLTTPFSKFYQLIEHSNENNLKSLKHTLILLNNLRNYIETIANSKNAQQKAFMLAKNKFSTTTQENDSIDILLIQADTMPEPIRSWLNSLARHSWQYVLDKTTEYLVSTWQTDVLPEYNTHINNRYPIFKNATRDISLAQFVHFFGPTGTIHNYFMNYLSAFVDITKPTWEWRMSHGSKLNLNNEFLIQLERAAIIKTMFFNNQQQFQINFNLRLESLNSEVKAFQFNLNEQNFVDNRWSKTKHPLAWPTVDKKQSTSITFINRNNDKQTITMEGLWGLFKLIDKSQINADMQSDKHFQIVFNLGNNSAHYELVADNVINPFMPNIINEFRAPTTLR